MYDLDNRKLLSALCYGSIFFSAGFVPIVVPIVILVVSNDSVVKDNAKEAINFYINLLIIYVIIMAILYIFIIPLFMQSFSQVPISGSSQSASESASSLLFLMIPLQFLVLGLMFGSWILAIIAIVSVVTNPNTPFRYPLIFRFL
ncbi:MAG TPA: DUF4870 domain-containing protein [Nostocaceae cyanobacterium]|nr:DUF4870 domain-containing protein [Nostocaceae cyanobacterium]